MLHAPGFPSDPSTTGGLSGGWVTARPAPGTVVAGKYVIEHVLGEGGMGFVVAARHLQLQRRVALKFLLPSAAHSTETAARFMLEAQSASRIGSENVARVLDVGQLESGQPFMVMEYLEGRDLGAVLDERRAPLPVHEAIDYVLQALEALGEAHLVGIVHRDVKPANLFLTRRPDGRPLIKVLDFGLSKDVSTTRQQQSLTRTSTGAMGSPLYMAPEQVKSARSVTFASDIWSVGVVLYELVSNDAPFHGENIGELLASILADDPRPLTHPSIPQGLVTVVMRCLRKNAAERWPDLGSLARALAPFATPAGQASAQRIAAMYASSGRALEASDTWTSAPWTHASTPGAGGRTAPGKSDLEKGRAGGIPKAAILALGALGGASIIGVGAVLLLRGGEARTTEAQAPSAEVVPTATTAPPSSAPATAPTVDVTPSTEAAPPAAERSASAPPSASPSVHAPPSTPSSGPPKKKAPHHAGAKPTPTPEPPPRSPSVEELVKQGRH